MFSKKRSTKSRTNPSSARRHGEPLLLTIVDQNDKAQAQMVVEVISSTEDSLTVKAFPGSLKAGVHLNFPEIRVTGEYRIR